MTIKGEILERTNADGLINPREIVDWARDNPSSDLHGQFDWDDKEAGDNWRLHQARRLIAIHIRDEDGGRMTISLVKDRHSDGGYRHLPAVLSNRELRKIALQQALDELQRWEARYLHLSELARIFAARRAVTATMTEEDHPTA